MARMEIKGLNLSKNVLQMKFMKRTKDKIEEQQFEEEGEEYFGSQITARMKKETGNFVMEPSFIYCQDFNNGRLSFQGMNLAIEKLMEERENNKRVQLEAKRETDVSDEQMTVQWQKIRAKFDGAQKRRKSQQKRNKGGESLNKKLKFLKPVD